VRYDSILELNQSAEQWRNSSMYQHFALVIQVEDTRSYDASAVSGKTFLRQLIHASADLWHLFGVGLNHASIFIFAASTAAAATFHPGTSSALPQFCATPVQRARARAALRNRMRCRNNLLLQHTALDNQRRHFVDVFLFKHFHSNDL
jgi:hypothetical protein